VSARRTSLAAEGLSLEDEARNIWDEFQALYYAGRLSSPTRIRVVTSLDRRDAKPGEKTWARITKHRNGHLSLDVVASTWDVHPDWVRAVILHEMVHAQIGVGRRHHGDAWNAEVRRLSELGALRHVV
jgi:hypothetical protein